jgi:hypothetical protein
MKQLKLDILRCGAGFNEKLMFTPKEDYLLNYYGNLPKERVANICFVVIFNPILF